MTLNIRDYRSTDAAELNKTVLFAFEQYSAHFNEWETFCERIGTMSSLSDQAEIIVAEYDDILCGAVAYYSPGKETSGFFPEEWASIRLLVVDPKYRGQGIARALMSELIVRAKKDSSQAIGLHTSRVMEVALSMYIRMGFKKYREIPPIHGVPYSTYKLDLSENV